MELIHVNADTGWALSVWNTTYSMSWEMILKAAKAVYDYYDGIEILENNKVLKDVNRDNIDLLGERPVLEVRGMSKLVKVPVNMVFYNQLKLVKVNVCKLSKEFETITYESFNRSMCNYLTSVEIAMNR